MRAVVQRQTRETLADALELSRFIFTHPELGFAEVQSSEHAAHWLRDRGFDVGSGSGKLATAFKASGYPGGRPRVGFMMEYDALPDIGHACGHNLIAAMSAGAAVVADKVIRQYGLSGTAVAMGTPAEENNGGGKALMVDSGWFDDLDCALIVHPADTTMVEDWSLAGTSVAMTFHGKKAHVTASAWLGANALAAATQALALVDAWRAQFKDYTRVNGIFLQGGQGLNVLTDLAQLEFLVRTSDDGYLGEVVDIVKTCGECAAKAMRCTVDFEMRPTYKRVKNDPVIERLMGENFAFLGEDVEPRMIDHGIGATDVGNVSQKIPAIHAHLRIRDGIHTHTQDFLEASGSPEGEEAVVKGIDAMAMTALDIIMNGEFGNDSRTGVEE
jgi:amidohydrolase